MTPKHTTILTLSVQSLQSNGKRTFRDTGPFTQHAQRAAFTAHIMISIVSVSVINQYWSYTRQKEWDYPG